MDTCGDTGGAVSDGLSYMAAFATGAGRIACAVSMLGSIVFSRSAAFTRTAQSLSPRAVRNSGNRRGAAILRQRLECGGARVDDEVGLAALVGGRECVLAPFGFELADVGRGRRANSHVFLLEVLEENLRHDPAPSASSSPSAPRGRRARRRRRASASGAAAIARAPSNPEWSPAQHGHSSAGRDRGPTTR